MNTNNPATLIAALNVENRQLRQQLNALAQNRGMQALFDKLACAALTGAAAQYKSPTEAAQFALQCTDAFLAELKKDEPEQVTDHEMNQRP